DSAIEVDVDVIADFEPMVSDPAPGTGEAGAGAGRAATPRQAIVCGLMEHIEQAGIHSGDSACAIPHWSLPRKVEQRIRAISRELAAALSVNGLMNVQLAVKDDEIYILEVNPRASRTAPFVSKAKHVPWPKLAAKVMMGKT